jgi:hypothetical protein
MLYAIVSILAVAAILVALCAWAFCRAAACELSDVHPGYVGRVPRKRGELPWGDCPVCGRPDTYLTRAGQPNRRYHRCPERADLELALRRTDALLHAPAEDTPKEAA